MSASDMHVVLDNEVADRLVEHIRGGTTDMVDRELLVPITDFTCPHRAAA